MLRFSSCVDIFSSFLVHNNRLVSHLHGRGTMGKAAIYASTTLLFPSFVRGVDLYRNDERGSLCLEKPRRDLRKRVALKEGSRSRWTETPPAILPPILTYVCTYPRVEHCYIDRISNPPEIFRYKEEISKIKCNYSNDFQLLRKHAKRDAIFFFFLQKN